MASNVIERLGVANRNGYSNYVRNGCVLSWYSVLLVRSIGRYFDQLRNRFIIRSTDVYIFFSGHKMLPLFKNSTVDRSLMFFTDVRNYLINLPVSNHNRLFVFGLAHCRELLTKMNTFFVNFVLTLAKITILFISDN